MSILFKVPLEDHPRMCGEQNQLLMDQVPIPGSPPCVRGTDFRHYLTLIRFRITPACAGNRFPALSNPDPLPDHPRVCGEQAAIRPRTGIRTGSPPRVRGTEPGFAPSVTLYRITPACAGNSRPPTRCSPASRDHPRVCGEQQRLLFPFPPLKGSPPRVRGTDRQVDGFQTWSRITPACAGNSCAPACPPRIS